MNLFLLYVWLEMSAQPQIPQPTITQDGNGYLAVGEIKFTPEDQYVQFPTDTGYIRCPANPGILPLACKTSEGKEVTVGIVAADETDGKLQADPSKPFPSDHNQFPEVKMCGGAPPHPCNEPPIEPVDVPAVQEPRELIKTNDCNVCFNNTCTAMACLPHKATENLTTCADKSRILEHDENSPPRYWCRKVQP